MGNAGVNFTWLLTNGAEEGIKLAKFSRCNM